MTTLLCDMGNISSLEDCRPLQKLPCWTKPIDSITSVYLAVTHKRLSMMESADVADRCMYALTAEAVKEFIMGDITNADLINYVPPARAMTKQKYKDVMSQLSFIEETALLLSLDSDLPAGRIVTLT